MHILNNLFKKCYLINLDRAHARLHKSMARCHALGMHCERFPAVDGVAQRLHVPRHQHLTAKYWNAASVGLIHTTLRIVDMAIQNRWPAVLIMEDDFLPTADFNNAIFSVFNTGLPADWEMLFFGWSVIKPGLPVPGHSRLVRLQHKGALATHFYAISERAYPHIRHLLTNTPEPLDVIYYNYMFHRGRSYAIQAPIALQDKNLPSQIVDAHPPQTKVLHKLAAAARPRRRRLGKRAPRIARRAFRGARNVRSVRFARRIVRKRFIGHARRATRVTRLHSLYKVHKPVARSLVR